MKQKDIALVMMVVVFSAIVSFIVSNVLLGGTSHVSQVETVQAINSDFDLPGDEFFNQDALNPTKLIQIGDTNNPDPFAERQTVEE